MLSVEFYYYHAKCHYAEFLILLVVGSVIMLNVMFSYFSLSTIPLSVTFFYHYAFCHYIDSHIFLLLC
jgi:hypothetical protein